VLVEARRCGHRVGERDAGVGRWPIRHRRQNGRRGEELDPVEVVGCTWVYEGSLNCREALYPVMSAPSRAWVTVCTSAG